MPVETLVKFDGPFLVRKDQGKAKDINADPFLFCKSRNVAHLNWNPDPNAIAFCQGAGGTNREIEEVLNTIVPPIVWEEDGKTWRQVVSSEPATRADVIYLHRELGHRLLIRQARSSGIDPIRRELYAQAFDELIRQVTTSCPERGLLLLRVRDEMKMTISTYQALNDHSSAFGIVEGKGMDKQRHLRRKFTEMAAKRKNLEWELRDLEEELSLVHRTFEEQKMADDKRHFEQIQFLKRANQILRQKFESLVKARVEEDED